jgi:hypothetical protein
MILYHSCHCNLVVNIQKSVSQLVAYSKQIYMGKYLSLAGDAFIFFELGNFFKGVQLLFVFISA